ncbi:PP2C family protein-serine/threonine phosphatase [Kineosporia sp. A_224]|uniref:PP2C family protein-serine/threonine phosphatase n=1 Tax=Kineosporia sp. A_224 TaxID=1962180 RepID=UPI000B4AE208|nr:GAF domain-containing SpoIIE family protein phosphatase [Kineosporia sp. A_224]
MAGEHGVAGGGERLPGLDQQASQAVLSPSRLRAVAATGLLDTAPEEAFDRYSRLASTLLGTPLSFVTVVDDTRSFWKSCIGVESDDPADRQNTVQESFCQYVVASGKPLVVDDAATDPRTRDNPSVRSMGVAAWAGWPVWSPDGEVLGTFCVVDTTPRTWTERDEQVLETLSQAVAGEIALRASRDEAYAAAEDLRRANQALSGLARTLQESLLPPRLPDPPGLEVAARYLPGKGGAQVVGDFYDVFPLASGRWGALIGDVCGHGVDAARTTALARHTIRTAALAEPAPSRVLGVLNDALLARDEDDQEFVSAVYAVLTPLPDGGVGVVVSRAGHPSPVVHRAGAQVEAVADGGLLLGVLPDVRLPETTLTLAPRDALVLFTDGLTEQPDPAGRQWGEAALRAVVRRGQPTAGATADAVVDGMLAHAAAEETRDDAAVLVLRVR